MAELRGTTWTLGGAHGATDDAIVMSPTNGVKIFDNSDEFIIVDSTGLTVTQSAAGVAGVLCRGPSSQSLGATISPWWATHWRDHICRSRPLGALVGDSACRRSVLRAMGVGLSWSSGSAEPRDTECGKLAVMLVPLQTSFPTDLVLSADFGAVPDGCWDTVFPRCKCPLRWFT